VPDGPQNEHGLDGLPPEGRFITVEALERAVVEVGEPQGAKKKKDSESLIFENDQSTRMFILLPWRHSYAAIATPHSHSDREVS